MSPLGTAKDVRELGRAASKTMPSPNPLTARRRPSVENVSPSYPTVLRLDFQISFLASISHRHTRLIESPVAKVLPSGETVTLQCNIRDRSTPHAALLPV